MQNERLDRRSVPTPVTREQKRSISLILLSLTVFLTSYCAAMKTSQQEIDSMAVPVVTPATK